MTRPTFMILFSLLVTGCKMSPSISVLGSFFPDWLFCAIAGLVLTLIAQGLMAKHGLDRTLAPPALVLPALMLLFSMLVWLLVF